MMTAEFSTADIGFLSVLTSASDFNNMFVSCNQVKTVSDSVKEQCLPSIVPSYI
jgi:hypothetical protein